MWSDNFVLDGFVLGPIEGLTLSFISGYAKFLKYRSFQLCENLLSARMSSIFHHISVMKMSGNGAKRRDGISRKKIVNLISEIAGNCAVNKSKSCWITLELSS